MGGGLGALPPAGRILGVVQAWGSAFVGFLLPSYAFGNSLFIKPSMDYSNLHVLFLAGILKYTSGSVLYVNFSQKKMSLNLDS